MSLKWWWDVKPTDPPNRRPLDAATGSGQPVPYHGAEISDADTEGNRVAGDANLIKITAY